MKKTDRNRKRQIRAGILSAAFFLMWASAGCGSSGTATEQATRSGTSQVTEQSTSSGAEESSSSPGTEASTGAAKDGELAEKTFPVTEEYVKLTGRTGMNNDIRWLIHSASKVEFKMKGTKASIVVRGDAAINYALNNHARYAVYVNGKRTGDHLVNKIEEEVEIFSSDQEQEVEIAVVKLSEASNSIFGIKEIHATVSEEIQPLPEKALRMEFIGDSITCGYGIDDEDRTHSFSTETEDATKTYAVKCADDLDADYSLVCYSGHGIISGYSGDGRKSDQQLVPDFYELLGRNYGSADPVLDLSQSWDFSRFVPDYIVINLGTNDESYIRSDPEKKAEYRAAYVEFLKMIRKNNPGAHLICSLGIMGDGLYPEVEQAAKEYSEATGDTNISTLHFKPQDGSTGYAASWHPTEATNRIAADALLDHIKSLP